MPLGDDILPLFSFLITRSTPRTHHALAYRLLAKPTLSKSHNPPLTCFDLVIFNMATVCRFEFGRRLILPRRPTFLSKHQTCCRQLDPLQDMLQKQNFKWWPTGGLFLLSVAVLITFPVSRYPQCTCIPTLKRSLPMTSFPLSAGCHPRALSPTHFQQLS